MSRDRAENRDIAPRSEVTSDADCVRPVQMRLRPETIQKIDELRSLFETSNRTDAVVRAIRLAHSIVSEMNKGARIELHRTNGEVRELLIR